MENWKKIKGFENYEISDYGNIKSFCLKKERILKHKVDKDGYLGIGLFLDKKIYYKKIHRLVMYHFSNEIEKETKKMLSTFGKQRYIANLGHGVYPDTDPEKVKCFIETVKAF